MSFLIRRALYEDSDGIGYVFTKSWQTAYKNIVPDEYLNNLSPIKRAERFQNDFEKFTNTFFYVADLNEKIIGNLVLHKCRDDDLTDTGEIGAIYLLPEYWSFGYGKIMIDFSINTLKKTGYKTISLWVLEENIHARRFYEKNGFVFDGTRKEINIGKPLIEIRYRKEI